MRGARAQRLPIALLAGLVCIAGLVSTAGNAAAAQELALAGRGPRFLRASTSDAAEPVEIEPANSVLLKQVVSLRLDRPTVGSLLDEISRQTGLTFFYAKDIVAPDQSVTLRADSITVATALIGILMDAGVDVVLTRGKQIALVRKRAAKSQAGTITGKVTDAASGQALAGVDVFIEGTSWRAVSVEDGQYWIADVRPGNYTVTAERIGYGRQSQEVTVAEGAEVTVDFVLNVAATPLDEIVITGSNIRGQPPIGSPLVEFYRLDLDRSGYATSEQFVRSLTQNFSGGITEITAASFLGGEDSNLNVGGGTGINLRGMGNDATLVLLNGRRLAPAGFGNFVDVSLIPFAALERVEVLTDGASAIYGSDAIGGVVNFVTRRDYTGAETRLRYGAGHGSLDELGLGQMFGTHWSSGAALVSYDYYDRSRLDSGDRPFTRAASDPIDLLGEQTRHSLLANVSQDLNARVSLFADGFYASRDTDDRFAFVPSSVSIASRASEQHAVALGARMAIGSEWQAEVSSGYSRDHNSTVQTIPPPSASAQKSESDLWNEIWAIDGTVNGPVFSTPAGAMKMALGAHYRHGRSELLNHNDLVDLTTTNENHRNVRAVYAEIAVPLLETLEASLAGRYERYSHFGSTTNPKLGIGWKALSGLTVRGTLGTSFRAPLLNELNDRFTVATRALPDPAPDDSVRQTVALILTGNNANLQPERATVWTAGFDWRSESVPGLAVTATYFGIDYEDRIQNPIPSQTQALVNEALHPEAVARDPSIDVVNEWFAHPLFFNLTGSDPDEIGAVVDNRLTNIARRSEDGVDVSIAYTRDTRFGIVGGQIDGTHLFNLRNQLTPATPAVDLLNTVSWPVDFRLRSNLHWSRSSWDVATLVSYTNGYRDVRSISAGPVESWTTVDTTVRYRFGGGQAVWLRNVDLSLSVQNLLDTDPPFVVQGGSNSGINYDPTNANPIGRFVALRISKQW